VLRYMSIYFFYSQKDIKMMQIFFKRKKKIKILVIELDNDNKLD
jgi:hypothetical protein